MVALPVYHARAQTPSAHEQAGSHVEGSDGELVPAPGNGLEKATRRESHMTSENKKASGKLFLN